MTVELTETVPESFRMAIAESLPDVGANLWRNIRLLVHCVCRFSSMDWVGLGLTRRDVLGCWLR